MHMVRSTRTRSDLSGLRVSRFLSFVIEPQSIALRTVNLAGNDIVSLGCLPKSIRSILEWLSAPTHSGHDKLISHICYSVAIVILRHNTERSALYRPCCMNQLTVTCTWMWPWPLVLPLNMLSLKFRWTKFFKLMMVLCWRTSSKSFCDKFRTSRDCSNSIDRGIGPDVVIALTDTRIMEVITVWQSCLLLYSRSLSSCSVWLTYIAHSRAVNGLTRARHELTATYH